MVFFLSPVASMGLRKNSLFYLIFYFTFPVGKKDDPWDVAVLAHRLLNSPLTTKGTKVREANSNAFSELRVLRVLREKQ